MSLTETRPEAEEVAPPPASAPPAATGLAGWISASDHKQVGRMWIATAIVFGVGGSVVGGILGVERIGTGLELLDGETFGQVYTLHGEVAVFGLLVPLFLGLATYLVPLQVGAGQIAFPRGSALAYWTYVVSGGVLVAAYAANGGVGGGSAVGADLHLLALGGLNVATGLALVSVLTTILCLRAPGMTLLRAPLFTWSLLVGGGLTLLAAPVLVARLIEIFVAHHYGDLFPLGSYDGIAWFWSVPQVYALAVPAAGVALEIVPVLGRSRLRLHAAGIFVLGATGVLGVGMFARDPETFDDLLYVAMGVMALLPALALVGLLADTLRRGTFVLRAPLLLALGAAVHLALGALAGAALVIEPLELQGTVWEAAQVHYTLYGGALLGAFAALWYWAPKLWGVHLGEGAGRATFVLTFLGGILLAAPDLVNGLFQNQALGTGGYDDDALATTMNMFSAFGSVLATLGVLVVVGDLVGKVLRRQGSPATDDPWGGATLEWATTSPPPAGNFAGPLPEVGSPTPLIDSTPATAAADEPEAR
ncbi:MAG: cbb3-type cytochrome c oxidase subunit I [Actinomycetota bacterium]|nr:cbb3-type cytochrome c oxidase subunit I [Actinomycetota bacterium]